MPQADPLDVWRLCVECAKAVYGFKPPDADYQLRVAKLLFGTAAHESRGFRYRRQISRKTLQPMKGWEGGWSLWQFEKASVIDSLDYLKRHGQVRERASRFVWPGEYGRELTDLSRNDVLHESLQNDRMAVCFARLHYLRKPGSVPSTLMDTARYWKLHFNTEAGKGTVPDFLRNWAVHCKPLLKELGYA
jgi:hypothetical protein